MTLLILLSPIPFPVLSARSGRSVTWASCLWDCLTLVAESHARVQKFVRVEAAATFGSLTRDWHAPTSSRSPRVINAGARHRRKSRATDTSGNRTGPRSHDAAGGMESLAGGACALGEVGWTFGSLVSYNVTKCDMRRSMCRSDVSVNAC